MKILTLCLEGSAPPLKKWSQPLVVYPPPFDYLKISPQPICSLKSLKYDNYDKLTYSFPLLLVPPNKPVHQAIHYSMANFRPLLDPKVTRSLAIRLGLNQDPSDSECSALTNFPRV